MRTTQLTMATLATATLIGFGAAAPVHAFTADASATSRTGVPTTTHERGNVLECTGTFRGRPVYASLYDNSVYGSTIQIVIGDGDTQVGGGREVKRPLIDGRQVHGALKLAGSRAVIDGHARRVGPRSQVTEEYDDAGQHISVRGINRALSSTVAMTWRNRTVPLTCDGHYYDLKVTKVDTTGQ